MTLIFKRTLDQAAALTELLNELQNPSSPNYHKWLTPEQFGDRFGAADADINRVTDWLRSQGFAVDSTARGRGWIVFSGSVAQVQNTFHTEIHHFLVGSKTHYAPALPPSVPQEFADFIDGIRGLDDFYVAPLVRARPLANLTNGTHALAPGDIARIYDFPTNATGSQSTIAVVGESDINLTDIRNFRSMFQLPPNDPTTVLVGDDPGVDNSGPLLEADTDLEWVGGIAPNATIIYAYATDALVAAQNVIDQNLAPILTFSFGTCEPNISQTDATTIQSLAQQANAQGITWIASSGDGGAASCDQGSSVATQGLAVTFPASIPEITGVGGTEFNEQNSSWSSVNSSNLSSVNGYLPEVAWNDTSSTSGLLASGGGASILYPKPLWQVAPGVPNDGARDVPDLALDASPLHDPYIVISDGKTYGVGGTSLSAPVFAGIVGLVEPTGGFGNINPSLYSLATAPYGISFFHDIITGNNIVPCTIGTPDCTNGSFGYFAGPGYDLVTGLGSLDVLYFSLFIQPATSTTLTVSSTQVPEGTPITLTVTVRSYNGTVPTGTVSFLNYGSPFGNALFLTLDATGKASTAVVLPAGTYSLTAVYGNLLRGSTSPAVTVVVTPAPPAAPVLTLPANGATNVSVNAELSWNTVPFATSYDLYFGTSPSPPFWGNVTNCGSVTSLQCFPGQLATNTTYYWKVVARNGVGASASPVWSFTTTGMIYVVTTLAGSWVEGVSPDGTIASQALLSDPTGIAIDRSGAVYFVEYGTSRVRKISTAGILSTVAGGGTGGDGGPATSAQLNNPVALAIDAQENLYISDGNRIRMVSVAGIITTIAGGANGGYSGDGGPAVNVELNYPSGLAVDSRGNLYIADTGNGCIREISGGIISTFAGQCGVLFLSDAPDGDGGPATSGVLIDPEGIAVDATGNIDIAEGCRIRKVSNGIITTIAGLAAGCTAGATMQPYWLAADAAGNLYFSDYSFQTINKVVNGVVTVIAGGGSAVPGDYGPGTNTPVNIVGGLAVDSAGKVYYTDTFGNSYSPLYDSDRVRLLTPASTYTPSTPNMANFGTPNSAELNGASFAPPPLAPGSIADLYGMFSYASPVQASGAPLPTTLAGVSVQIQFGSKTINAPLFYASYNQINIQIPWELAGQSSMSIEPVLNVNQAMGVIQPVSLAQFAPGIFTTGTQGAIVNSSNQLVNGANPASAGDIILIYCTGLGPVTNQPASGNAASTTALSETTTQPTVTIGGIPAEVLFSGLAPGSVGEYQVNVEVPSGVTPGSAVPVVLSIGGATSNTVMISVK